jgi:hypothetical protein
MRKLTLAAAIAAALLAGCGGGSSTEDEVATTANTYLQALGSEDYAKACHMLTPDSRRELFGKSLAIAWSGELSEELGDIAKEHGGDTLEDEIGGCVEVIEPAFEKLTEEERAQIAGFRFNPKDIKVNGTTATVPKLSGGGTSQLILIKGKWRVSYDAS